ncbi:minor capsid protein [Clostridium sp.]|uniref:minor capsid protein n=1 Tax=Clostridium sp. TaxID=1506 RepID=UPI002627E996|nr:minor capsid protein [Clostridium sp.]
METNQNNRSKIEQINKLSRDNSNTYMKPVYKKQKEALNKMQMIIGLLYMKYAVEGLVKLNSFQRATLMNDTARKIVPLIKELGNSENNKVTDILGNAYRNVYYQNADLMGRKVSLLTSKAIKKAVNTKIDKELFSERIWKNKNKLSRMLKKSITNILKGKLTVEDARKQIEKAFNVTAYESYRLLNTELTRVHASASEDIAKKLGIKRHEWSATFEHSCEHCMSLDGQVFDIGDDNAPIIPAHPFCECLWINLNNDDTNYENSDIIKEKPANFTKLGSDSFNSMNKEKYYRMKYALENQGVKIIVAKGDDLRYLDSMGAEAMVIDDAFILHKGEIPSASAFFEEIIHLTQNRDYGVLEATDFVERDIREIEANRKLLKYSKAYGFTEKDTEDIERNLKKWEESYFKRTGEYYDKM